MISRRQLSQAFGAIPLALASLRSTPANAAIPVTSEQRAMELTKAMLTQQVNEVAKPLMSKKAAFRLLMQQKDFRDRYTTALYQRERDVNYIDHDLDIYKSFSKAAKITFQRQRNVDRSITFELTDDENTNTGLFNIYLAKAIGKVMWGK